MNSFLCTQVYATVDSTLVKRKVRVGGVRDHRQVKDATLDHVVPYICILQSVEYSILVW